MKRTATALAIIVSTLAALSAHGQNTLQFTGTRATQEGAILLNWASNSNEVYELDYADSLIDTNTGTITWNTLYTDYPSHGTNTFIADAGNYDHTPGVLHPKYSPMRFYRVMHVQDNDSASNPSVTITTVTNGQSLSGDVNVEVVATSSEILADVKLYIDGEEQWPSSTSSQGTNVFVINTCEWPAGPHVLFATAKSQSGLEGLPNGGVITYGRSASPYVNVTFDNLITRFDLSQNFFEPSLGQTQQVSAVFAANSDWTLEIQDGNNNDVVYQTGSGTTMSYAWDGTGTNGVALPDGVYSYLLTAQTNGEQVLIVGGGGDTNSPPSPTMSSAATTDSSSSTELYAMPSDGSGEPFPFILYPPGAETNQLSLFEASVSEMLSFSDLLTSDSMVADSTVTAPASASPNASAPSAQASRGPKRKPRVGVKGSVGSFGICYKTYGTNGFASQHPPTGWPYPLQTVVAIDDQTPTALTVDYRVAQFQPMAEDFSAVMTKAGWKQTFLEVDHDWAAVDIKKSSLGGNSIFNTCNFGILMTHGSFGNNSTQGNSSDGVKYTYCWLGPNDFVKLSDMDFGSTGTDGLRWMTIFACNILKPENYDSMNNHGLIPVNDNLHLLLGFSTYGYASTHLGQYYANYMLNSNSIPESLAQGALDAYNESPNGSITNTVRTGVSGWTSCMGDTLWQYNDPDLLGLQYVQWTVYIP